MKERIIIYFGYTFVSLAKKEAHISNIPAGRQGISSSRVRCLFCLILAVAVRRFYLLIVYSYLGARNVKCICLMYTGYRRTRLSHPHTHSETCTECILLKFVSSRFVFSIRSIEFPKLNEMTNDVVAFSSGIFRFGLVWLCARFVRKAYKSNGNLI